MGELREREAMICRACGREERASEGYPCLECGTFICVMCSFKGIVMCRACVDKSPATNDGNSIGDVPLIDWPED
jgi:hypothetical protein